MRDVSRRVLLTACETEGEMTYFEGRPFDGVGVEVDLAETSEQGELTLWRYVAGRRENPSSEPFFHRDHAVIRDKVSLPYNYEGPEVLLADGRPFTGLVAELGDTHLVYVIEVVNGLATNNSIGWHEDGTVSTISTVEFEETGTGSLEIQRYEQRHDRSLGNATSLGRITLALGSGGESADKAFQVFDRDDPRWFAASCHVEFDSHQKILLIELTGADFFDFVHQHPIDPGPARWLPTSLPEIAKFGIRSRLDLRMSSPYLATILTALGPDALKPVRFLELSTFGLESSDVAPLLELPNLRRVAISERARPEVRPGIRQLCIDLKTRRPNITVMLNGQKPALDI